MGRADAVVPRFHCRPSRLGSTPLTRSSTSHICGRCISIAISPSTMSTGTSTIATSRAHTFSKRHFSTSPHRPGFAETSRRSDRRFCGRRSTQSQMLGVRIARAFGSSVAADGFSRPYISAVAYGSAVYGFLALVLSAIAARRIVGVTAGTLAAVWFGTPLVFYMYVAPGFSHANSAFAVAAFVVAWLHVRRDWSAGGVAMLGALAGADGDGARAGFVHRCRPGDRLRGADGPCGAKRESARLPRCCGRPRLVWLRSASVFCRRRSRISRCTASSGRRRSFSRK